SASAAARWEEARARRRSPRSVEAAERVPPYVEMITVINIRADRPRAVRPPDAGRERAAGTPKGRHRGDGGGPSRCPVPGAGQGAAARPDRPSAAGARESLR